MSEQDTRILAEKLLAAAYARIDALKAELASVRSQARREALEEAAKVAEGLNGWGPDRGAGGHADHIAKRIRRLAEQEGT